MTPLYIPSPNDGVWNLGPLPIRGYALCIILGIVVAVWLGERRWAERGGVRGQVSDIAIWAVPFGLVGGRLYHVATDWRLYFGEGREPITALYVWQGGLGIWGAIALGGIGAWIGARRTGIRLPPLADALAPGILVAQAIGRWGNWFNQELYGSEVPKSLPWSLQIDRFDATGQVVGHTYHHATFLYEFLWNLGVAAVLIWLDRRLRLGHGRVFALYVMGYTLGRGWIENLRVDDVQLDDVLGLRLNVWTSIVLFVLATVYFVVMGRLRPGREESVWHPGREPDATAVPGSEQASDGEDGQRLDSDSDSDQSRSGHP